MLFFEITSVEQIIEVIKHNPNDTKVEIMQFHHPDLMKDLTDRLPTHVHHFALYDIAPEAFGRFIDAIGLRFFNKLPEKLPIIIELGVRESEYAKGISELLNGYGIKSSGLEVRPQNSTKTNNGVPKLTLPNDNEQQQYQRDKLAQNFPNDVLTGQYTPPISDADLTVYASPLSPRSPDSAYGDEIELQEFPVSKIATNKLPNLQQGVTFGDLNLVSEALTDLNRDVHAVGEKLQTLDTGNNSRQSQQPSSASAKNSYYEEELQEEHDFVLMSRIGMSQPIPRTHAVNLARLAVEHGVANAPINRTDQKENELSPPGGWVRAPTAPPIPKQVIPTLAELEKFRAWWEQQKAKPPLKPPPRLARILAEIQDEDRKEKRLPPIKR